VDIHTRAVHAGDRRKPTAAAANAMHDASVSLLVNVLRPAGVDVRFSGACDFDSLRAAVAEVSADRIFMETISNPLLRLSVGIEAAEDIIADLGQALGQ
jgi:O-acetylhomoserine/O-acetylserine sulfhydrylase-like pyridoxal-dependent enzyme